MEEETIFDFSIAAYEHSSELLNWLRLNFLIFSDLDALGSFRISTHGDPWKQLNISSLEAEFSLQWNLM